MLSDRPPLARDSAPHAARLSNAPIYAMLFAMQGARSMFIVLASWFTLEVTGQIGSVGQVLICGQLVVFLAGPFLGPYLDRFARRRLFATGETIHAGAVGLLAVIACVGLPRPTSLVTLCVIASLVSLGSVLSYPSSQALLQQAGSGRLARTVSLALVSGQIGNILGSVLAGICLPLIGIAGSLAVCGLASVVAIACLCAVDEPGVGAIEQGPHLSALARGLVEIVTTPELRTATCALLLAYASAHVSNALLAGFARYDLKLSPQFYGWIAAMYSAGGLIGSFTLTKGSDRWSERCLISIGIALLAFATAALATARSFHEAMVWQGLIGLSFALVRIAGDVTVLKSTPNAVLGRVRSDIEAMIGLVAIFIYLTASLASFGARPLFLALSGLFACSSLAIFWAQRKRSRSGAAETDGA